MATGQRAQRGICSGELAATLARRTLARLSTRIPLLSLCRSGAAAVVLLCSAVVKPADSVLVRSAKDVLAGTVAGVGITLVGHPFGQTSSDTAAQRTSAPSRTGAQHAMRLTRHALTHSLTRVCNGSESTWEYADTLKVRGEGGRNARCSAAHSQTHADRTHHSLTDLLLCLLCARRSLARSAV